jgi:predicted DNA-binding protein with PD1-like motif
MKEGKYFSHTHITFSDTDYKVFGGHLFDAKITAAGEFIMQFGSENITREMNPGIGLPLWCLEESLG